MRVTTITARVKASKEVNGCWKTIEFGAEGVLESGDDWKKSQDQLFAGLGEQLKKAFRPNGQEKIRATHTRKQPTKSKEKTPNGSPKPESKPCPLHPGQVLKLWRNENGGQWYSHRLPDGSWCSGERKKRKK